MTREHYAHWLTLHYSFLPTPVFVALLARFGTIESIFHATESELRPFLAASPVLSAIQTGPDPARFEPEWTWLAQAGNQLVTWQDQDYPRLLRELPDPPLLLFVSGDVTLLRQPQIAIVGARNPTPVGVDNAAAFAGALARAGLVVTSGLALGIDAAAHRGALAGAGKTIAVTGTGLDRVYPAQHRALAHEIVEQGALVSELPLGSPPRREHFPRRNRLISGMSVGTLVVEAAVQSGSLITARLANEQGREVFAIPGSIHSPLARGCHALIRQGAKLVETAEDVLEELRPLVTAVLRTDESVEEVATETIDEKMQLLMKHLGYDPVDMDTLSERSGLTPGVISSMLLQMELRGLVAACPGGKYLRTFKKKVYR